MILVIDKAKKSAAAIADMFFYMGVLAKAVTPKEAFSEIGQLYRAALIISPNHLPDAKDFIRQLKAYNSSIPIFAVENFPSSEDGLFAKIFNKEDYASTIMAGILDYTAKNSLPQPGDYRLAGMDLSCDIPTPTYFWEPFPLTRTEAMIVRYLVRTYPNPTSPEDILKYAYRGSRVPEIANVRTHISIINKKFRNIAGRNLVEMSFGKGYRVCTPELMDATV